MNLCKINQISPKIRSRCYVMSLQWSNIPSQSIEIKTKTIKLTQNMIPKQYFNDYMFERYFCKALA